MKRGIEAGKLLGDAWKRGSISIALGFVAFGMAFCGVFGVCFWLADTHRWRLFPRVVGLMLFD